MKKILAVDNDQLILQFLNEILTEAGHHVAVAQDGLAALEVLKTYTPDIITVDLVMPNIDGKQLCKIIREKGRFKDAYIIILSATVAEEEINIVDLGANACIAKAPFEEMAKNVLGTINEPDLATARCLSGEVIGLDGVYPRRMTKELLSAKNHLELILSKMTEGIVEITPEGRIVYANPAFFSLMSESEERLFGSSFVDLFTKEDRKRVRGLIETGGADSSAINEQTPVTLNGYQVTLELLSTENGGNAAKIVILNNVTEQNRAWKELQFRVEMERLAANISTHFMSLYHTEIDGSIGHALQQTGEFTDSDCSFLLLFSDDRKEIVKTHLWHSGITGGPAEHANRYPVQKLPWAIEKLAQSKYISIPDVSEMNLDGVFEKEILKSAKINCLITVPILYAGSLLGCLGFASVKKREKRKSEIISLLKIVGEIFSNALEHKRNEEEQLRLFTAVEQAGEGIAITDLDGKIIYVNPAFEHITEYTHNEVIGKTPLMLMAPDNEALYWSIWGTRDRGGVWKGRVLIQNKIGAKIHIDCTISPVRDQSGNIVNHVAVMRDATKEVNMEIQVRQYQKMEAVGTLAGGIAHDFNNILSSIIGNAEIAALNELPEGHSARYSLDQIIKSGYRAKDLVKRILAFSRQQENEPKQIKLTPVVKEVLNLIRPTLPSTIQIQEEFMAESDTVVSDPTEMFQVVMNLCTNAGQAMSKKGSILKVTLTDMILDPAGAASYPELSPGPYLVLRVSDTGCGMSPEIVGRVFEPYFTTKRKGQGTGLGLAVALGIVKKQGGVITIDSKPGQGSTFNVLLPKSEGKPEQEIDPRSPIPSGNEHILFIDDEYELAKMAKQMLEELGYKVSIRTSSVEALELFRSKAKRFDLVITDMSMLNLTGDKLAIEMLRIKPEIPIILYAGFGEWISESKAKSIGIREFAVKPIMMREIAQKIRRALDA